MFDHPQVLANGFMADLEHDNLGALRMPASPVAMSDTPVAEPLAPPVLGAHTVEVLLQYGYTQPEVDGLIESGTAWTPETIAARDDRSKSG
jgi:crotonobetainyl-CoA:carnitine CoA-transferase CaiB-like acyl-CoA transferase